MINILRRRLLKFGLAAVTVGSLPLILQNSVNLRDNLSAAERSELKTLYLEWIKQGHDEPGKVIADLHLENLDNKSLQYIFERDFIQEDIFEVNGLILSFAEAAILAAIGSVV